MYAYRRDLRDAMYTPSWEGVGPIPCRRMTLPSGTKPRPGTRKPQRAVQGRDRSRPVAAWSRNQPIRDSPSGCLSPGSSGRRENLGTKPTAQRITRAARFSAPRPRARRALERPTAALLHPRNARPGTMLPPAPSPRASGKTKTIAARFGRDLWSDSSFQSGAIRPAGQAAGRCPAIRSSGAAQQSA